MNGGDVITLSSKTLRAELDPYGARLSGLWMDGWPHSLVLGPATPQALRSPALAYFGVLVGPVANRISGAAVDINGTRWRMQANEGSTALHSGPDGLHARTWTTVASTGSKLTLSTTLEHGVCRLPGRREITTTYLLSGDTLTLEITAISDATTIMNIAHHPYWNLSGAASVADHQLQVDADQVLDLDARNLPTGLVKSVAGTDYDFRRAKAVATDKPLDANLCLAPARRDAPVRAARLSTGGGPTLEIETTEPGLQVYNGYGLETADIALHSGQQLGPCAGVALEPQGWPDAPRHPRFPSILLEPGETYRQITRYCLS